MKTTTSKTAIQSTVNEARKLESKARSLRQQSRDLKAQLRTEEETILRDMVNMVADSGAFMTAAEISRAMGGVVSVHEVAGQLTWARNSADSGRRPQPYFGPAGCHMRHDTMSDVAPRVEVEEREVTRQFAEVDETGAVIPGGRSFKQTERRNIYNVAK